MKRFESKKVRIDRKPEEVFNFLADFDNFKELMPEQVINWQSDHETCSFTIQGMADLTMKYAEKTSPGKIVIIPGDQTPFDFKLLCDIESIDNNSADVQLIFLASLNPFIAAVASTPLANFVNMLADKLKELADSGRF